MDPKVRQLYKKLIWVGRDYPSGISALREKMKAVFQKSAASEESFARGEFVYKELEALVYLHKYRSIRKRYDSGEPVKE
ncbi:hypothetical protein CYMTET_14843 [Cymbomonas tetramitiformis]|uniref:Uncharacterized protein n=1 Tax=Cymbomonas tetramitiformis TaxID=36881 RepID=A0AAE0L9Y0_9CHLO|nr:hypothetical protein CYMTET_14843 [Cymbomonas tetramitiformis]